MFTCCSIVNIHVQQRIFGRFEFVLHKSVESNEFDCMQIIVHTWTNNTPNYENMDQVYCLFLVISNGSFCGVAITKTQFIINNKIQTLLKTSTL